MVDPIFVIGIIFLVLASGIGGYVVYHKEMVMKPLILAEQAEIENMTCEEIDAKHASGQYWSFKNWRLGDDKVKACIPK